MPEMSASTDSGTSTGTSWIKRLGAGDHGTHGDLGDRQHDRVTRGPQDDELIVQIGLGEILLRLHQIAAVSARSWATWPFQRWTKASRSACWAANWRAAWMPSVSACASALAMLRLTSVASSVLSRLPILAILQRLPQFLHLRGEAQALLVEARLRLGARDLRCRLADPLVEALHGRIVFFEPAQEDFLL